MKVKDLIEQLSKLPSDARVLTIGDKGCYEAEPGNLSPFKVMQTKFGVVLFIDDGISWHEQISDFWEPLDQFINCPTGQLH